MLNVVDNHDREYVHNNVQLLNVDNNLTCV
jgi:hypothetical protein